MYFYADIMTYIKWSQIYFPPDPHIFFYEALISYFAKESKLESPLYNRWV